MYYLHKKVKKGIEPLLSVLQTNALPLCYLTFDQPNLLIYQSWLLYLQWLHNKMKCALDRRLPSLTSLKK